MDPFDAYARAHWRYSQEQPHACAHAGGEIRKLDGREFVVLSGRHHPVKATPTRPTSPASSQAAAPFNTRADMTKLSAAPAEVETAIGAALSRAGRDLAEVTHAIEDIRLATMRIEARLARVSTTFELIGSAVVAK